MKTKEELNALKEEVETVNKKLAELSEEELTQVYGGMDIDYGFDMSEIYKKLFEAQRALKEQMENQSN